MYRTTFTVTILHEEPIPDDVEIAEVLEEAMTGDYVADIDRGPEMSLSGPEMAAALTKAGSQPEFFSLDEEGNPLDL